MVSMEDFNRLNMETLRLGVASETRYRMQH